MSSSFVSSTQSTAQPRQERTHASSSKAFFRFQFAVFALLSFVLVWLLAGCGGGYVGTGVLGLSATTVTLDSAQSFTITAKTAGSPTLAWTLSGPSCSGSACGTVTNQNGAAIYTAPTVSAPLQVTLTAAASGGGNSKVAITVNPLPSANTNLPSGSVGTPYTTTIVPSGGTSPVKMALSGSLPEGLNFDATTGIISGNPGAVQTINFGITLTDASQVPGSVNVPETIAIGTTPTQLTIIQGNPPAGTVGVAYATALTASGGTAPYMWSVVSGSLPGGLTLNAATGAITGTPTTAGSSTFTAQVQDTKGTKVTASFTIVINAQSTPLTINVTSLPNGTVGVAYSATVDVSGGTAPYTCVFTGTLPAGLTATNCTVSGTPTATGTSNLTVKATDSSSPQASANGPISITIGANAQTLMLTNTSLPNGTVGTPYSATVGVAGGAAPYNCTFAGALPAGLTANGCTVSGTPTTAGTSTPTVTATDSSAPPQSVSGPESITINAATVLVIGNPPAATVGDPYTGVIPVSGGKGPYTCTVTSGTLPTGLTLGANCTITGTPTVGGTTTVTVQATDSSNPTNTSSGMTTITVNSGATLTVGNPPTATAGTPYTGVIPVTGGTGPYTCTITTGVLPDGLTLGANCAISGTPTTAGSTTPTVKVTDSSHPTNTTTGPVTITVVAGTPTLTVTAPPPATVGDPYTGPIGITGGKGPYTCALAAGSTLTNGLSLHGCIITGTPTAPGNQTISVTVTDSNQPPDTTTAPITIVVNPAATLTLTGSLPNAIVNVPYSQTLQATGGVQPYTYAITAGALPAGLALNPTTGVVSGTPTTVGASSFTVTATDSETTPQTASLPLVLLVTYAKGGNESELNGPYAYLFQGYDDGLVGVLAYQTAAVGSFTADGTGVINAGELDENHQTTATVGTTANSIPFLGTYTIGTNNTGYITITRLNTDGTTSTSSTYAVTLKAPVTPVTISTQGSLIEYDTNTLGSGSKGSGTLLAQTTTAFANGLNASYVFGVKGDTPCLLTCNASLVGGAVAAVGEFTGTGGVVTGESDATLAATTYPKQTLAGSFNTADANGRLHLTMTNEGQTNGYYPGDYAVYIVDATQAFIMSIDKHSDYILLAGSMQARNTATTATNTALTGPFIGYENAATNPGLLSALVENVLNFSTATIFRTTATANGNCNVTNSDTGGLTALVTNVGGLLGGLTSLLGEANATGATTCAVDINGRAVLTNPSVPLLGAAAPRVAYLSAPDKGYFVETGYAGLGNLEPQVGSGTYTQATFKGTYVFGETPASSVASINTNGVVTADGAGNETSTVVTNVGVGTLNVLSLATTQTAGYSTPDATTGRFIMNTTDVVYVISPGRFVFVDTNALTTSPSVTLLY